MTTTLGVTGQRTYSHNVGPIQRDFGFAKTHAGVKWFAEHQGVTRVISGMAEGVDQWAATAALTNGCVLVAALPFPAEVQSHRWSEQAKETYHALLASASEVHVTADKFSIAAYNERNGWIVDHADVMLVVTNGARRGGTWNTIRQIATHGDIGGVLVHTARKTVTEFADGLELAVALGVALDSLVLAA